MAIDEGYYTINLFVSERILEKLKSEKKITNENDLEEAIQNLLNDISLYEIAKHFFDI